MSRLVDLVLLILEELVCDIMDIGYKNLILLLNVITKRVTCACQKEKEYKVAFRYRLAYPLLLQMLIRMHQYELEATCQRKTLGFCFLK